MKIDLNVEDFINIYEDKESGKFYATLYVGAGMHYVLEEGETEEEAKMKSLQGKNKKIFMVKNGKPDWIVAN